MFDIINSFLQNTLYDAKLLFNSESGTLLFMTCKRFANAFKPTFLLFDLCVWNFVCREVRTVFKFSATNSFEDSVLQNSLYNASACLYLKKFSGVDLLYISCSLTKEISLVSYFAHTFIAFADDERSFCLRFVFNDARCQISEL